MASGAIAADRQRSRRLPLALLAEVEGESKVALEATYGWEWLAELLEEAGYELHLAHPLGTKAIASARVKTDAVDARTLAAAVARGSAARRLRRSGRAARPARSAAPPGWRSPNCAPRSRTASMRCWLSTASCTATATCSARAAAGSWPRARAPRPAPAAAGELACPDP
jgi:Transposase